jgi:hypothetical protein
LSAVHTGSIFFEDKNHKQKGTQVSHLTVAPLKILDIEALRAAAKSLGGQLEQSKVFTSYTGDKNPCEYRITLPGVNYQVGVIYNAKDKSYSLSHDNYGYQGSHHDGHLLEDKFGRGLAKLTQQYTRQVVLSKARNSGWMVSEKRLADGRLQLQMVRA